MLLRRVAHEQSPDRHRADGRKSSSRQCAVLLIQGRCFSGVEELLLDPRLPCHLLRIALYALSALPPTPWSNRVRSVRNSSTPCSPRGPGALYWRYTPRWRCPAVEDLRRRRDTSESIHGYSPRIGDNGA